MNKQMQHYKRGSSTKNSHGGSMERSVVLDDRFSAQYQDFLDDVFSSNVRQKQINTDAEQFLQELETNNDQNRDIIQHYEDRQTDMKLELQNYIDNLKDKKYSGQKNIEEFESNIKKQDIINERSFISMHLHDLMDIPKKNQVHKEKWFDLFKQEQFKDLKETLEDIGQKLYRARMTEELKENRQKIDQEITKIIEEIEFNPMENKSKLFKLEKLVLELQQYDDIIPQIMGDLMNKASEFAQQLLILSTELKSKCKQQLENIEKHNFYNNKSFQFEYKNLSAQDPKKLRVSRFGYNFHNSDLRSLQEGIPIKESIPLFFVEFFRERNRQQNLHTLQDILVLPSNFFELLIPPGGVLDWNNMNYSNVKNLTSENKGNKNTIFDKYKRILMCILLSGNKFLLIEIKTHPEPEILIYDSNYNMSARFHEKIVRCIKAYIIEELKDKTDMLEGECIQYSRSYIAKGVNCPQIKDSLSAGLYFIKNLEMCAKGSHITPYSYNQEDIQQYRLVLFSSLLRIGVNEDRPIVYDSVL